MSSPTSRYSVVTVLTAVFLLVGLLVRVRHYAQTHSYWYDEAYLLLNLTKPYGDLFGALDYALVVPSLFLCIEKACFDFLGPAEWATRLPAFVSGLLALAVMVPLARQTVGGWAAWLPVAFVALSRRALSHGCEVRPYATDLLVTELTFWATAAAVGLSGRRKVAWVGLLALATVAPWVSFPAPFVIGGAVVALAVRAYFTRERADLTIAVALGLVLAFSAAAMWYVQARHLYYPGLSDHWGREGWDGFPDSGNVLSMVFWPVNRAVKAGGYATAEMGWPLFVLSVLGVWRFWTRSPAFAAAIVSSAAFVLIASYLRKYPFADRTMLFIAPAIWLSAASGVAWLAERLPSRSWLAWLAAVALIGPDVVGSVRRIYAPPPYPPAREVFAQVNAERRPGEVLWVSHIELYRVYHGFDDDVLTYFEPWDEFDRKTRGRRVWFMYQPGLANERNDEVRAALRANGHALGRVEPSHNITLEVWEPSAPPPP